MIMNTPKQHFGFSQKLLVVALLAAIGPAQAADNELAQLTKPDSTIISLGLGLTSGGSSYSQERSLFGQYNGWRKDGAGLLLDFDMIQRDDAAGLWTNFEGRNLGLDNRELRFSQQKQGDWKYSAEYSELVRHDPRTINTSLNGAGSTTPQTAATPPAIGAGSTLNLELKRKGLTLAGEKWLTPNLSLEVSFKNEEKDGARLSGIGSYCSNVIAGPYCPGGLASALLLLPEPINSTTRQFEARLNYFDDKLSLNGAYYGSFYNNANSALTPGIAGVFATNPTAALVANLQRPLALPPDNESHQLSLSGNYRFDKDTRANFSTSYTHSTQNDGFVSAVAGLPGSLAGEVDRAFAQLGVTTRATKDITLAANTRYERVDDKTPLAAYNIGSYASATGTSTNARNSLTRVNTKVDATIQLPQNYRAIVGGDWDFVKRDRPVDTTWIPATSITSLRETTGEGTLRAEVRRTMSEELNGGVLISHSKRDGYRWTGLTSGYPFVRYDAVYLASSTLPMTMLNRERDKIKLMADWQATSDLSLQFMAEDGRDSYADFSHAGLRSSGMNSYGVDAALKLSDDWKMSAYANQSTQTQHVNQAIGYLAALKDLSTTFGVGVKGKVDGKLDVGGDLSYLNDRNRVDQNMSTGAAIVNGLPEATYRLISLKLFANYALDKTADVRVDLVHQQARYNDWTWGANGVPFAYSDNSTVSMQPNQNVTFLGARYIYKFR